MVKDLMKTITKTRRGSPFIEEGILIVFGLFIFVLLLGTATQVLDWFLTLSEELIGELNDVF